MISVIALFAAATQPATISWLEDLREWTGFLADSVTVAAAVIGVYFYLTKREQISAVFRTLINYASRITLEELRFKLERLNDLHVSDKDDDEIINVLNEISGQINGNARLRGRLADWLGRVRVITEKRSISEPQKRSLVSELRETLRHIELQTFDEPSE